MQFIEDFKQKVGKWVFLRELKNNKRSNSVCNLSNAKSIGILYDATNESQINEIKPFIDYFFKLKKEIKALGFVNDKQFSFCHSPKLQYDFFNIKGSDNIILFYTFYIFYIITHIFLNHITIFTIVFIMSYFLFLSF